MCRSDASLHKKLNSSMKTAVLTALLTSVLAMPSADEVTALPGWSKPLPMKLYSGYVNASKALGIACQVHYWYLESEGSPSTDPTILWTNGGPGASSMFGVLVELGPFLLNENSLTTKEYNESGVPTLYRNEYGWTKLGGVLMFDLSICMLLTFQMGEPDASERHAFSHIRRGTL